MKNYWHRSSPSNLQTKEKTAFFGKEKDSTFFNDSETSTAQSFFSKSQIQPKLTIGQPNDKYEQEADATADKVVRRLSNGANSLASKGSHGVLQTKCASCEQEEKLQTKEEPLASSITPIRRKPVFESNEEPVEDQTSDAQVQTKSDQFKTAAPGNLEGNLNTTKGKGASLSKDTQTSMGSAFGSDFSQVKVHTDGPAVNMNNQLQAQAFTHGQNIYFNQGKYDEGSAKGKRLLAHELTHVVQQGNNQKDLLQKNEQDDWDRETYRACLNDLTEVLPQRVGVIALIDRELLLSRSFSQQELTHLKSLIHPNSAERAFVCREGIRALFALYDTMIDHTLNVGRARQALVDHPERYTREAFERGRDRLGDRFERLHPDRHPQTVLQWINPPALESIGAYCLQNCPATAAALHDYLRTGDISEAHCSLMVEREQGFGYYVPDATRSFGSWSRGRRSAWRFIRQRTREHGDFVVVEGDRVNPEPGLTQFHYFIILNIQGSRFVVDAYLREVTSDIRGYLQRLGTRRYSVYAGQFYARPNR